MLHRSDSAIGAVFDAYKHYLACYVYKIGCLLRIGNLPRMPEIEV